MASSRGISGGFCKALVVGVTMFCAAVERGAIKRVQRMLCPYSLEIRICNKKTAEGNGIGVLLLDGQGGTLRGVSRRGK